MLISDWSSDLCSSDLNNVGDALSALDNAINQIDIPEPPPGGAEPDPLVQVDGTRDGSDDAQVVDGSRGVAIGSSASAGGENAVAVGGNSLAAGPNDPAIGGNARVNADGSTAGSEEHTAALHSLMRIPYGVFCLQQKKYTTNTAN